MARKILLADDSVTAQNMGRKILADAGYEVITVNNGSAALKKIAELKPDLVILDVYMPGYSGLEVCQRLKESQDSARIPVLLTVGKLEPFKPEEAQRVRAEGFIVKPFEASELLAALSKLEDKVVPRAEPSKPGRFARAIAAAEESGRGRNEPNSDDNGWKSRIGFPHEKTAQEKAAEEAPIYNPMNRDLRTVVETAAEKKTEKKEEKLQPAPETNVDVAALVPPGLPKDVTPEEVAAIAAAAAQIHLVGATLKDEHQLSESPSPAGQEPVADRAANTVSASAVPVENISAQPNIVAVAAPLLNEEVRTEAVPHGTEEYKIESAAKQSAAAETLLQPGADEKSEESQDVPVTMAVATESVTAANQGAPRWTAVSVALEAEESTISLDQEMQKAYAAFVAEETASNAATALAEVVPLQNLSVPVEAAAETHSAEISNSEQEEAPQAQPVASPEAPASELQQVPESYAAATVSFVAPRPTSAPEPASSIPQAEAATIVSPAEAPSVETKAETSAEIPVQSPEPTAALMNADRQNQASSQELPPAPQSDSVPAETAASGRAFAPIVHIEPGEEHKHPEELQEDPETVKTTAAAWASWRHIRDTVDTDAAPKEPERPEFDLPASASVESAAMAVAAGAEQAAQETTAPQTENPSDVESIVDSVLADLRPRLMAEITRKMSEKK